MRYVPSLCLSEGMVLAKSLYGTDGNLLLQKGLPLKQSYIDHIVKNGFQGIYIDDKLSDEIEIQTIIDDEIRNSAVKVVRNLCIEIQTSGINKASMDRAKELVRSITEEILKNKDLMVNMIDLKSYDNYTYFHSVNVGVLSIFLGTALGIKRADLYKLGLGALLHDIGKVFIDREIIDKPGALTTEEFETMKKHPEIGYEYLTNANLNLPLTGLIGVLQHHERTDGSGYPEGLSGDQIHLFSRIISIADVFDAMTSDRSYRSAMMPSAVMEYIMGGAGKLFDAELVSLFTRKVAAFPLGTCVKLSNGRTAIVVENYEDCCLRPKVKLIDSSAQEPVYWDLKNDLQLSNVTIIEMAKI